MSLSPSQVMQAVCAVYHGAQCEYVYDAEGWEGLTAVSVYFNDLDLYFAIGPSCIIMIEHARQHVSYNKTTTTVCERKFRKVTLIIKELRKAIRKYQRVRWQAALVEDGFHLGYDLRRMEAPKPRLEVKSKLPGKIVITRPNRIIEL